MPEAGNLGRQEILDSLLAFGQARAARGAASLELLIAGGSALALDGLRDATRAVDSLTRLSAQDLSDVAAVAEKRGLPPQWLNDSSAMFLPAGVVGAAWPVALEMASLVVRVAPTDVFFVMKAYAFRVVDRADLRLLWPLTSFSTPDEAARAIQDAYPHEEPDPHLATTLATLLDL